MLVVHKYHGISEMQSRLAVALVILGFSCAANAGLITLTATPTNVLSGFSLTYNDSGNGLFEFGELASFSGVTFQGTLWETLIQVPAIAGISTAGGTCLLASSRWCFTRSGSADNLGVLPSAWTYSEAETPTNVPEPSTAFLLGAGLIVLALRRRRAS